MEERRMKRSRLDRRTLLERAASSAACGALVGLPASVEAGETEDAAVLAAVEAAAKPLPEIGDKGFADFIDRFGSAKVVLMGESTHGTDEFYRARAAMTERLVREHGFTVVAVEADWPDAARVDAYVRHLAPSPAAPKPFERFPVWMWRNRAVLDFADRLRAINGAIEDPERRAGFFGLDMYSLSSSMEAVFDFVERHDPVMLGEVRERYGCLSAGAPTGFGALRRGSKGGSCADDVASVLKEVLEPRLAKLDAGERESFDALQNARVVAASEAYERASGAAASWNLRDTHMFDALQAILEAGGPDAKAVVWAHNSHVGDAAATGMGERGEINIGHLCRREYGERAVLIGFESDRGTVTAADDWDEPGQTMTMRPSIPGSWGALMREAEPDRFLLDIRGSRALAEALGPARPERFIGVVYRPRTERISHYVDADLRASSTPISGSGRRAPSSS
jgi:erythromycin esterase-like protein